MRPAKNDAALPESLRGIITPRDPFGPYTSEDIDGDAAMRELFDTENIAHLETMQARPAFVIGRRGSGKTAFLRSPSTHNGAVTLDLNTSECFASIKSTIKHFTDLGYELFVAHTRNLWRTAIWHAVLVAICDEDVFADAPHERKVVVEYLEGLVDISSATPMSALSTFCRQVRGRTPGSDSALPYDIEQFTSNGIRFQTARDAAVGVLTDVGHDVLVLMDSMEDFERVAQIQDRTMEGLLALIGERRRSQQPFTIRFCMPAELYHVVKAISRNDLKDFSSHILLHWHATELLRIAARRFTLYVDLHLGGWPAGHALARADTGDPRHPERVLRTVLPATMTNALGTQEDPVAYLLRHTQLLPRHLILLLNRCWQVHLGFGGDPLLMSGKAIRRAVRLSEGDIVSEICKAYEPLHPAADDVCRALIPHLPATFDSSTLHQAFRRHASRVAQGLDYHDCKRMLIEIGALGRYVDDTERYVQAEFEYTAPNRLSVGEDEALCLHPLFAGPYGCLQARPGYDGDRRPVYPFGWDTGTLDLPTRVRR